MTRWSFDNSTLSPSILKALQEEGYDHPTLIQQEAIPAILERRDVLASAQTGTGKTAAFALPVLDILGAVRKKNPVEKTVAALILSPTRELAVQIGQSFATYGKFTGLKQQVVYGGVPIETQISVLEQGTDILVATPGRLLDLTQKGLVSLGQVELLILDEADRMLDMGFIDDLRKIINALPQQKQTVLFSATMTSEVLELSDSILKNPVKVEVHPLLSAGTKIDQSVYFVEKKNKAALLIHVLKNKEIKRALVFTRTKLSADELVKALEKVKIKTEAIHGNKSQEARERALGNFKEGSIRVLVATDIAARGIDIEELKYVINYELPIQPETYIHRIGRTGRAGNEGIALSFCEPEELQYLRDIKETIGGEIPFADHPYQLSLKSYTKPAIIPVIGSTKKPAGQKKNKSKKRGNFKI